MPETNFLTSNQIEKKPGKRAVRKNKTDKFGLSLSDSPEPIKSKRVKAKIKEEVSQEKYHEANGFYRKIAVSFIILTVLLILTVVYFGYSKVTLVIIPAQEKIVDSLSLEVIDSAVSQDSLAENQIFGVVRQAPIEQSRTFSATGKEILGEEVKGKVTIINNYIKNQPLVASTRLLSNDNKLFRLKNTVNVPAGGRVEAEVYADEAKPEMVIGSSKFTIPGLWAGLQDKIYAQSQEKMAYSQRVKYIIKQTDIDNAVNDLKKELLAAAKKEIGEAFKEYDQSIIEIDNNSVSREAQGKVGEEKEKFTVKIKSLATVIAFKDIGIYQKASAKLGTLLADDKEIVELSKADISYSLINYSLGRKTAAINVNFAAKVSLKDTAKIIKKNNLASLNLEELQTYLGGLPEIARYEVKFFPSFMRKMPDLVDRIKIEIVKPPTIN